MVTFKVEKRYSGLHEYFQSFLYTECTSESVQTQRSLTILRDSIRGKDAAVRWRPKLEVEISRV